ncbi:MAG: DUF58 domain-containing protein, partial [Saprospiraceae bacterium]|nr:DUF58 domain-containing protein [Saprospiraceae bacterium]
MRNIFIHNRFFWAFAAGILLFVISFPVPIVYPFAWAWMFLLAVACLLDYLLLFGPKVRFRVRRRTPKVLSLGDENPLSIEIQNLSNLAYSTEAVDELPFHFQQREFSKKFFAKKGASQKLTYQLRPLT